MFHCVDLGKKKNIGAVEYIGRYMGSVIRQQDVRMTEHDLL